VAAGCSGDDAAGTGEKSPPISDVLSTFAPGPAPGPPKTVATDLDACGLLDVDEIEDITEQRVADGGPGGASGVVECVWLLPDAESAAAGSVSVLVYPFADPAKAAHYFSAVKGQLPDGLLGKPDIGDAAFWYSIGRGSVAQTQSLWVLDGDIVLKVFAYEYDDAVELAKRAVSALDDS
jgi:hypothetical protein